MRSRPRDAATLLLLAACSSRVPVGGATSSGTSGPGPSSSGPAESTAASATVGMTGNATTVASASGDTTGDDDAPYCPHFYGSIDLGADGECMEHQIPDGECTIFEDTCPPGLKCNVYGDCVAVEPDARGLYEPCTESEPGYDDCARTMRCQGGTCVANCRCSLAEPHCDEEMTSCLGSACLPPCDPFKPDCPGDLLCTFWYLGFHCNISGTPSNGTLGDPCSTEQDCLGAPVPAICFGSYPASYPASRVPGCTDPYQCCMELCHFSDGKCSQPEAVCSPFYDDPYTNECFGDIGGCMLPE